MDPRQDLLVTQSRGGRNGVFVLEPGGGGLGDEARVGEIVGKRVGRVNCGRALVLTATVTAQRENPGTAFN